MKRLGFLLVLVSVGLFVLGCGEQATEQQKPAAPEVKIEQPGAEAAKPPEKPAETPAAGAEEKKAEEEKK